MSRAAPHSQGYPGGSSQQDHSNNGYYDQPPHQPDPMQQHMPTSQYYGYQDQQYNQQQQQGQWVGGGPQSNAGPSRQPRSRQTPQQQQPPTPRGLPGEGWSSVHPSHPSHTSPGSMPPPRPMSSGGVQVKLEDLVSRDRRGPGGLSTTPLSANGPGPGLVPASGSRSGGPGVGPGGGGGGGVPTLGMIPAELTTQQGPSEFIKKLYKMLEEENAQYGKARGSAKGDSAKRGSVGWGRNGTTFVVWDMNDFTTKILPQTFRHSNFSSFVRQLNKYGFSKIKHLDEETGQLKENIWEFQHPNFQAGGKSDLDSIKRKAVVPKKGNETQQGGIEGDTTSPSAYRGVGGDEGRLLEMETRVRGLEDRLAIALEDVRVARNREVGFLGLMREVIGHMAGVERETAASNAPTPMSDSDPSPRMMQLFQLYDQLASSFAPAPTYYNYSGGPPQSFPMPPPPAFLDPRSTGSFPATQTVTPLTDGSGSRESKDNGRPSPTSKSSRHPSGATSTSQRNLSGHDAAPASHEDIIESGNSNQHQNQHPGGGNNNNGNQNMYDNMSGFGPLFAETPAWLTEGISVPMQMYHRKNSDTMAYKLMLEALGQGNMKFMDESQDPLDNSPPTASSNGQPNNLSDMNINGNGNNVPTDQQRINVPIVQSSPFGTLLIPSESQVHPANHSNSHGIINPINFNGSNGSNPVPITRPNEPTASKKKGKGNDQGTNGTVQSRRGTLIIEPQWSKTPKILVVEDDVVYRQLSSKFLEKFGCVVETVENAHGAIAKMNAEKYDLVLMDIFFGPNMDGRKATSLIRQFDNYTPIISMTSNARPSDVETYLQSGMNDILAKPFTKSGLFGILDKHLMHLKALQLSGEVPRSVGVPPLSDQGVLDALNSSVNTLSMRHHMMGGINGGIALGNGMGDIGDGLGETIDGFGITNPLAAMGWSDDTYQIILAQYLQTGMVPDISNIDFYNNQQTISYLPGSTANQSLTIMNSNNQTNSVNGISNSNSNGNNNTNGFNNAGSGTIGTDVVFGDFNKKKRGLEAVEDESWTPASHMEAGATPDINGNGSNGIGNNNQKIGGQAKGMVLKIPERAGKESKKAKKG